MVSHDREINNGVLVVDERGDGPPASHLMYALSD